MCYDGKCMHCIEVETGALIFAILNVVSSGFATLLTIGSIAYVNLIIADHDLTNPGFQQEAFVYGLAFNAVMAIVLCIVGLVFAFAVVLITGVVQKKASLVKAYFVYGVLSNFMSVIGVIVIIASGNYDHNVVFGTLVGCFLYSLILKMIHMTYKKFSSGVVFQYSHKHLIEDRPVQY